MAGPQKPISKKHRECPALGRTITSAECGSQRGSKLACPAACPHYPFGAAGQALWLHLDEEWSMKALDLVGRRGGRDNFPALLKQHALPVGDERVGLSAAVQQMIMTKVFLERDAAGQALGDGWEDKPLSGLSNDERVMTRHRRHGRVTVIEVQRAVDAQSFLALDLFEPERPPFLVAEPTTAARAVRFTRLLGWLTHYPQVSRLSLPAFEVPHPVYAAWESRARAEFTKAAADAPGLSWKDYLSLRFGPCAGLVQTLVQAHAEELLARTDVNRCLAAYSLRVPSAEVEAVLREKPEFRMQTPEPEAGTAEPHVRYAWLRLGDSAALEKELEGFVHMDTTIDGVGTVATVRLYAGRLLVETLSKTKHGFARRMLDQYLGDKIAFEEEAIEDLTRGNADRRRQEATVDAAQEVLFKRDGEAPADAPSDEAPRAEQPSPDPARVAMIRQQHARHYEGFLDNPLDTLDGKAPRVAAADPALRPRLIELVKSHLHGIARRSRDEGVQLEVDAILDALGLAELK